jgi:hypothetical protein
MPIWEFRSMPFESKGLAQMYQNLFYCFDKNLTKFVRALKKIGIEIETGKR